MEKLLSPVRYSSIQCKSGKASDHAIRIVEADRKEDETLVDKESSHKTKAPDQDKLNLMHTCLSCMLKQYGVP